ncbi:MAG: DUF1015 domain-containing protein [Propionibacteriaceae bacterium]|jgi:uncharacterized protein (DUF1015 family)|nr:DUF1015 domain-containing protein [Propionibacteriaceae bacterium]
MPTFEPFAALRYCPEAKLDHFLAPPYDVLSDSDISALKLCSPHNIAWVDDPDESDPDRYAKSAEILTSWIAQGVLVSDPQPSFTIYRMAFTDATGSSREISGVLGGLEVVDEGAGGVLPHERTTPKASTDRLDLTRATATNMSPVWGLSLAQGLTDVLRAPGELLGTLQIEGVTHTVERVSDPVRIQAIQGVIASGDVLIADGHHRYGVSRQYRDEVRAATGRHDTPAEYTLTFVNELVASQLSIEAIHRLYDGVSVEALRDALSGYFELAPLNADDAPGSHHAPTPETLAQMVQLGRLVLLHPDGTAEWLTPKPGVFDGVRALDGAWLEHALNSLDAQVTYQHGLAEMKSVVRQHAAGVLIRPTSLEEIRRTATEGLLMPPKSTFFTPKLLTGFVLRPLA